MKFTSIPPCPVLKPYVKSYWMLEGNTSEKGNRYRFIPDGFVEMAFHLKEPWTCLQYGDTVAFGGTSKLVGQFSRSLDVTMPERLKIFYVKFYPWALYQLFGIYLSDFTDNHIELHEVFKVEARCLHHQLKEVDDILDMKKIIEPWLQSFLKNTRDLDLETIRVAQTIVNSKGSIKISELLNTYSRSRRRLQQQFSDLIGLSPKQFSRINRMYHAAKLIRTTPSFSTLAHRLNFYDQAHFIHDFQYFTGMSPKDYLQCISPSGKMNNFSIDQD